MRKREMGRILKGAMRGESPSEPHMGFQNAAASIAKKQGAGRKAAGAILAYAGRKASPMAKKANPRLMKISGMPG